MGRHRNGQRRACGRSRLREQCPLSTHCGHSGASTSDPLQTFTASSAELRKRRVRGTSPLMGELFHVFGAMAERVSRSLARLWTRHPTVFWLVALSFFILSTVVLSLAMVTLSGRP
jgi:hypothetical protein